MAATRNACRTRAGSTSAVGTVACHLVTGASSPAWSRACEAAPRYRCGASRAGRSLTSATTGTEAPSDSLRPDGSLAAPGPTVASHTPTWPVTRAYPSAA